MATKDYCWLDKPNKVIGETSNGQYSNLNLNQNHQCLGVSLLLSKNDTRDKKIIKISDLNNSKLNQNSKSWNKSSKCLSSSLNISCDDNNQKKLFKNVTNKSSSTLFLHIAAYENSIEAADDYSIDKGKTSGSDKTLDNAKQLLIVTSSIIQNSFEFPRQQTDKSNDPEIMQFKASQKLFSPNASLSRTEISEFYNSLTPEQQRFFDKYAKEREQIENELQKTRMQFHKEKKDNEKLQIAETREIVQKGSTVKNLQNDLSSKGIDINSKIPCGTPLLNSTYHALLKLIPQRHQRRQKVLEFFGLEDRVNDLTLLPPIYLGYFEQQFNKSRAKAVKNKELSNFEKEVVVFPSDKLPFERGPTYSVNSSNTVIEGSSTAYIDAETMDDDDDDDCDIPLLEAMESDISEPLTKKSRLEPYTNFPSFTNTACQTDLRLSHMLELEKSNTKLKNFKDKIYYHKKKSEALKEQNDEYESYVADLEEDCNLLDEEINHLHKHRDENEKLKEEIRERDEINMDLNDQLSNLQKGNKFLLKNKSGKFTVDAHACFSRLISQGCVAQEKVPIIILIVADLFKISIDAVPSRWTVGRDIHMVQSLNCEYIARMINECSNLSYLSDETTKFTKKLQATVLMGKSNKTHQTILIVAGVCEVPNKSAERCLQEFKQLLSNIAKTGGFDAEKFIFNTVINIRNLMGDQAATTKLLYTLFTEYRNFCLENSGFDEATKASLQRVNPFFCTLHILSNSTAIVFKSLLDHEKFITDNEEVTEATVLYVLNEVPRYFAKRSSGKYATAGQWETLAKEMELQYYKIDSNAGHRFIIRFIIASEIMYNRDELIGFLEHLGTADEALLNLIAALKNDMIVLHLHVLAILGTLILQPMWQLSEASESILEMSLYAPALINYLKDLVADPLLLFTFVSPFDAFPAAAPKEKSKAAAFLASLKERPIPVGVTEVVPMVAKNLLDYFEKQLEPFLSGIYASPDMALERETAGAPSTNMPCESVFGHTDRLFTTKPNMTTYNRSALTVAAKNRLFDYITKLPEAEQREMYDKAFNNKQISAKLAAEKTQQIHRENIERIEQIALKQQLEKKKKEAKRKQIAVELRECGFWLSVEEMEAALLNVPTATAIKYVKSNIRFRKAVWTPKFEPKNLLQFSHKKHTYTYAELVANLKAVIVADFSTSNGEAASDSEED